MYAHQLFETNEDAAAFIAMRWASGGYDGDTLEHWVRGKWRAIEPMLAICYLLMGPGPMPLDELRLDELRSNVFERYGGDDAKWSRAGLRSQD